MFFSHKLGAVRPLLPDGFDVGYQNPNQSFRPAHVGVTFKRYSVRLVRTPSPEPKSFLEVKEAGLREEETMGEEFRVSVGFVVSGFGVNGHYGASPHFYTRRPCPR